MPDGSRPPQGGPSFPFRAAKARGMLSDMWVTRALSPDMVQFGLAQIGDSDGPRMLTGVSKWAVIAIMCLAIFAVIVVVAGLLASTAHRNKRRTEEREQQRDARRAIPAGTPIVDPWQEAGRRTPVPPKDPSDAADPPDTLDPTDRDPPHRT